MTGTLDLDDLQKVVTIMSTIDADAWKDAKEVTDIIVQAEHKMLSVKEVADLCGAGRAQVDLWRETGILKGTKTGKPWMYSQEEVRAFRKRFAGKDISNRAQIKLALEAEKKEGR